jgi:hypothetical protein
MDQPIAEEALEKLATLVGEWTVDLPEAPDGVSIMGCDTANGTFFRDVQRGREPDLRPLGEGRGRRPVHDRLPPDLPKGRPSSAVMIIFEFLHGGGGRASILRLVP